MDEERVFSYYDTIPEEERGMNHFNPFAEKGRMSDEPLDPNNATFQEIIRAIKENDGKIPFSRFMEISLFGKDGYYSTGRAKLGGGKNQWEISDFTTSPETSPLFGRTIARKMIDLWQAMGRLPQFQIVELGAGTGALAKSFVESAQILDQDFYQALSYNIVEYGDLIKEQKVTLQNQDKVNWIQGSAIDFPLQNIEGAIISNELLDAFPIERVTKIDGQIKQKFVTVDEQGRFFELWQDPSAEILEYLTNYNIDIQEKVEEPINLQAANFQKNAQHALSKGAILTIDYGMFGELGEEGDEDPSVRYFGNPLNPKTGEYEYFKEVDDTPPYQFPGQVDITASVNFEPLVEIATAEGLKIVFLGAQRDFLKSAGFDQELQTISLGIQNAQSEDEKSQLEKDYKLAQELIVDRFGEFYTLFITKGVEVKNYE